MKKHLLSGFILTLLFFVGIASVGAQPAESKIGNPGISPERPAPTDSVFMRYAYVSNDGCPDYYLKLDSVIRNKVFVSLRKIDPPGRMCADVISNFVAKLYLGNFTHDTDVFFNGKFLKKVLVKCSLDKEGIIVKCDNQLYISEISMLDVVQYYKINYNNADIKLNVGDRVKFSGQRLNSDSLRTEHCPVVGVADCFVVTIPNPGCKLNTKGIVVMCGKELYIKEVNDSINTFAPVPDRLFKFDNTPATNTERPVAPLLKEGDEVMFGYNLFDKIVFPIAECRVVGEAKCFKKIIPGCELNRKGVVVKCNDMLYIEEHSMYASPIRRLFAIKIDDANLRLNEGDNVVFGGYLLTKNEADASGSCFIIGVALCAEVQSTPPPCVLNRKGIIVQGENSCKTMLFIRETTTGLLFSIPDNNLDKDSTTSLIAGLKPGYKVIFGGKLIPDSQYTEVVCRVDGVAQCYRVVDTTIDCELNRVGVVVAGIEGCANKYFIREHKTNKLFLLNNFDGIVNTTKLTTRLKPGDEVKFGAIEKPFPVDERTKCEIAGVVMCYEPVSIASCFTLGGYAITPDSVLHSGRALLIPKGTKRIWAVSKVNNGYFEFNNVRKGSYTVYVIPTYPEHKKYLPTFYFDKQYYRNADYVDVTEDTKIKVKMREYIREKGTGRIWGSINFDSEKLNDSVMMKNAMGEIYTEMNFLTPAFIPVLLIEKSGKVVAWTETDSEGNYAFDDVPEGDYLVYVETPAASAGNEVELTGGKSSNQNMVLKSIETPTSINLPKIDGISIYPNPAYEKITIVIDESTEMKIYNIQGQLLMQRKINRGENVIEIGELNPGVLLMKIGANFAKIIKR